MKQALYLLLFFNIIGFQSINAQEKLQYSLKKGTIFRIEQRAVQHIVQKMDSTEHLMNNNLNGIFRMEVVDVLEDKYVLDVNFESFKFKTESNIYGVLSDIDTAVPPASEEDIEAKVFQGLIGPKFRLVLLKTGQVESLTGIENLVNSMVDQVEIEDDFSKALIKKSVAKEFNNDDMKESLQQFTYIYPETKVKVNQTWQNDYTGTVNAQNNWKLLSFSKKDIGLEAHSDVQMEVDEGSVIMKLAGTQHTQVTSSTATGFIKTMTVNQQTAGTTTVPEMNNLEIPTTLTSTITYKLL